MAASPFHRVYDQPRYAQPSPLFPKTETTIERVIWSWEKLREYNSAGYRTSSGGGPWVAQVNWKEQPAKLSKSGGPSAGKGTACSPFTCNAIGLIFAAENEPPFNPKHSNGDPISQVLWWAGNGNLHKWGAKYQKSMGVILKNAANGGDDGWPRAAIFFNLAYAIDPTEMRKGDLVKIEWMPKTDPATGKKTYGGHAVYCWDVHLDNQGKVDAFQYISANGAMSNGGNGAGISVGGVFGYYSKNKFLERVKMDPPEWKVLKKPLFVDDDEYVSQGAWVTWRKDVESINLQDGRMRAKPRQKHPVACQAVAAARFHGVIPPEPYAMGGNPAPRPPEVVNVAPAQVNKADLEKDPAQVQKKNEKPAKQADDAATGGQEALERRLKDLYELGVIDKDPGQPDAVNDPATQAAVKEFQEKHQLPADGNASAATKKKVQEVHKKALETPEGRRYLTTGVGVREGGGANPAQAGGGGAKGGGKPQVVALYWRHGSARPGEQVQVRLVAEGADGKSFPLKLKNVKSGETRDAGAALTVANGRAAAMVRVPAAAVGAGQSAGQAGGGGAGPLEYLALADGLGETGAPLYVS
jgi:peptidoglycan hydrolase-like protein with peptidoglycan-binding domain